MSDLSTLVEPLKRAVAVAGTFDTIYADTTDTDLAGQLMDGFAEAQLDGFFIGAHAKSLDINSGLVTPDLTVAEARLVVVYSAANLIQVQLLNLKNKVKYLAKGAEYETEQTASLLTTLLKQFDARKLVLQDKARYLGVSAAFAMIDGYFTNATSRYSVGEVWPDYYDPRY